MGTTRCRTVTDHTSTYAVFPLDLTCPRCDARTVRCELMIPNPVPQDDKGTIGVSIHCPQCEGNIQYGLLPAEFTNE